ncbi:MAG: hypothetical protein ACI9N9_002385 [Enterobacterales bacterium]|jgi:hypothetical protein
MPEQDQVYDKKGIPIEIGDTIKIFHFVGARRKKHYMYKHVVGIKNGRFRLSHLAININDCFTLRIDNSVLNDFEIVQGYGDDGIRFSDRQKINIRG